MAAVIAMLQRMKLSAEAAGEITSATGQAILTIPDFAEMDKEGVDLVFCQLARPGGAGIKISNYGQQTFGLMMDAIEHWEKGHRGMDSSSLGYVVREGIILFQGPAATDPTMGDADDYEVVARHPIIYQSAAMRTLKQHEQNGPFVEEFVSYRKEVWDLLCSLLDLTTVTVIKPFKAKCDGRGSFLAVWDHHLGPNNVDHMENEAEETLSYSWYHTEVRTRQFEKLVLMHLKAHIILEGLVELGYVGID